MKITIKDIEKTLEEVFPSTERRFNITEDHHIYFDEAIFVGHFGVNVYLTVTQWDIPNSTSVDIYQWNSRYKMFEHRYFIDTVDYSTKRAFYTALGSLIERVCCTT